MNAAKRGRPRLPDHVAKRQPLNMKTTLGLRSQLATAAEISGRTLSHEVEYRLAESFLPNEIVFGSEETQALLKAMAAVVQVVEASTGKPWNEDEDTAALASDHISRILPWPNGETVASDDAIARAVIAGMLDWGLFENETKEAIIKILDAAIEERTNG